MDHSARCVAKVWIGFARFGSSFKKKGKLLIAASLGDPTKLLELLQRCRAGYHLDDFVRNRGLSYAVHIQRQ